MISTIKKYFFALFNTRAAGTYMLLFAFVIGAATFVENDFGTSSAQRVIFKTAWFELLLILFGICIAVNIFHFRMVQRKQWPILLFHTSIIIIILGAGITRYFGFEGIMHIREGEAANTFLSAETYLKFNVTKKGQTYQFDEPVLFATLGNPHWQESYQIGEDIIDVEVKEFIPNPIQTLKDDPDGKPILKIVIGSTAGREEYFISPGQTKRIRNVIYNFKKNQLAGAINIDYSNDSLLIKSDKVLAQMVMATQTKDTLFPKENYYPLRLRSLYSDGANNFVFGDFKKKGKVSIESENPKVKNESMTALLANITINGAQEELYIYGKKGLMGRPSILDLNGVNFTAAYGSKEKTLPFSIKLYDFIMDKYPGTNSASSYASEVQLIDSRSNVTKDYRIFMNNILDHDGYRFFQSSFDPDEQGTYLSVNHDFWGTWVSYIGYIFLTIGMIMALFSKKGRFYQLSQNIKKARTNNSTFMLLLVLLMASFNLSAQKTIEQKMPVAISEQHATGFSQLLVQDHKGRMKPVHTLTREIMRKLSRKESMNGLSADQVILGMFIDRRNWQKVPMIKLGEHETIHKILGVKEELAAYNDFFDTSGAYKLKDEVRRAYGLQPIDRAVYEKELMKIDEKINIASMVYSGRLLKIIPIPNDPNDTWVSQQHDHGQERAPDPVAKRFFETYPPALNKALKTNDYHFVDQVIAELSEYQQSIGAAVIPSPLKVKAEVLLNESRVFGRLAVWDILLGLAFLFFLFLSIFKPNINLKAVYKILFSLIVIAFVFHTIGLGLRWYISGRAPWSNGYESMIYIAWTSTLAGLLFSRKSFGGLAATMVLAATVLLVAHLSYLDPEITPLVPVLKSYWLTIHVSLEAGSYGFLMLGAIIGLINLILMIFLTPSNNNRVLPIVKEMSNISEMTLIGGLFMVSIGTYLGGVWANESWGRYWGWDAKETWALVTILVYAFILHMRLIPKMGGLFAYNVASLFGWASVIMTYYGVNYYLSGLHSYAAGDPIPVPQWVYYAVAILIIISILAYLKKRKFVEY